MASRRLLVSSICFSAVLLLLIALSVRSSWAQEGPTIKVLGVPNGGLTFDYQELQEMGGFQVVVTGTQTVQSIWVTGEIIDRTPCNVGHALGKCASKMLTGPDIVTINPGEVATLKFRIRANPKEKLDKGTYQAYVKLTSASMPATFMSTLVSPPIPTRLIPLNISFDWTHGFQDRMRRVKSDWQWLREPILALIVTWFLLWLVFPWIRAPFRRKTLGPVELKVNAESENENANRKIDETQRFEFEGLVKTKLDALSIRPPGTQPAASLETVLAEVIGGVFTAAPDAASKGIGSVIKSIIPSLRPKTGHSVECTLYGYENAEGNPASDKLHASMTVKSAKGATDATMMVSAENIEILALKVASRIYLHAFQDTQQRRTPKWEHFHTAEGFESYQLGLDNQKNGDLKGAFDNFCEASRLEPGNVLTRLAAASLLTQQCQDPKDAANANIPRINEANILEARKIYKRIVESYSDLIEPQYRLAANLSMWEDVTDPSKTKKDTFEYQRTQIDKRLTIWFCLKKCLGKPNEWKYWSKWAPWQRPRNSKRLMYKRVVKLSEKCFDAGHDGNARELVDWVDALALKSKDRYKEQPKVKAPYLPDLNDVIAPGGQLHKRKPKVKAPYWPWQRWGMDFWGARYNAACFYSIVLGRKKTDGNLREHCKLAALDQLKQALSDPASADARDWALENDPDLKPLRESGTGFDDWKKDFRGEWVIEQSSTKPKVPEHRGGAFAIEND